MFPEQTKKIRLHNYCTLNYKTDTEKKYDIHALANIYIFREFFYLLKNDNLHMTINIQLQKITNQVNLIKEHIIQITSYLFISKRKPRQRNLYK